MQRFTVILEPAHEGGFIACVSALLGCVTQGDTRQEVLAMAQDAICGYLPSLRKHGEWPSLTNRPFNSQCIIQSPHIPRTFRHLSIADPSLNSPALPDGNTSRVARGQSA